MIEIQIQNFTFFLAVIYGPNTESPTFYSNLKNRLLQTNGSPIICCGDWNLVLEFKKDTYAYIRENNINAKNEVMKMIQSLDLIDIWRARNPDVKKYTWVSGKRPLKMARLDFFLATPDIYAKITGCNISHGYRSNHSQIGIELDVHEIARGRGFWKFNHSLLHDNEYVK